MASDKSEADTAPETFKQQLDRVATERRNNEHDGQDVNPIIEKITEFVPAAAPLLGVKQQQDEPEAKDEQSPPGPPERPHHDHHIAEFVRDQHRSNGEDGLLSGKQ